MSSVKAHGWTAPGLTVSPEASVVRARRLPLAGEVLVQKGQVVAADEPVAQAWLPGRALPLPLAGLLGCEPAEVARFLAVRPGDRVRRGQPLASFPGVWGFGRREVSAPEDGSVEGFSPRSGQLLLRGVPTALRLEAHLPGVVSRVWNARGCEVCCRGAHVQGVYGIGGEVRGRIHEVAAAPGGSEDLRGAVCLSGEAAAAATLAGWAAAGAAAAVVGGVGYRDLADLAGRQPGFVVVLTEGFGRLPMAPRALGILRRHEGMAACVDGTTQIRAGVVRPEVVVPLDGAAVGVLTAARGAGSGGAVANGVGMRVRIVRAPDFGCTGVVLQWPAAPRPIATEAVLPVALVRLDGGGTTVVPRANVEPAE